MYFLILSIGVPAAQFEWRKEGDSTVRFRGATYTLYNTALDDNGIYTCTPVNMIGSGTSNKIKVDINGEFKDLSLFTF